MREKARGRLGLILIYLQKEAFSMKDEEKTKNELMASRRQIAKMERSNEKPKGTGEALKKKKETLFKWFVESSPIGMVLLEGDPPKTKFINQMCTKLFGYSVDEIPDVDHWWSLGYPDPAYRKKIMAEWNRKFKETSNTQFEFGPVERVVTSKDGSQKHIEFRTVSFGTTYLVYGIDLTERKRAVEESKEKEERFNALFNRSFDCVFVHDFDGSFLDANPAALDLLGYNKKEEAASLNFGSLVDKKQREKGLKILEEIRQTGSQRQLAEYQLKRKDGKQVYIETKGSVINRNNKPYAILSIVRDITERKEAEALLKKREDELKVKTIHLEETNAALNVVLRQREKDMKDLEDKITSNIREMVSPYVEKMKSTKLDEVQKVYLNLIKSHLKDVTSSFLRNIKFNHMNFTPTEVGVATLIREGKNSKEIAQLTNVSKRTVEFHRNNIRKKLDINNKKMNLRTCLLSLP
jgi:PAS domain S-box-containing protein